MENYRIETCRLCGKLMKRFAMQVYPGDSSCCSDCNKKVENGEEENPFAIKHSIKA